MKKFLKCVSSRICMFQLLSVQVLVSENKVYKVCPVLGCSVSFTLSPQVDICLFTCALSHNTHSLENPAKLVVFGLTADQLCIFCAL